MNCMYKKYQGPVPAYVCIMYHVSCIGSGKDYYNCDRTVYRYIKTPTIV